MCKILDVLSKDENIGFKRHIGNSVLWIYEDTVNILTQDISGPKIDQNSWKTLRNEIRRIIDILKLFCWRNWHMYDIIYDIKFNYIMSVNKKYEFCKCTFIIKPHERFDFIKYQ